MRILNLHAENIKRLVAVDITPDGDVVEITGRNGQGKTSVLDAIWFALAGGDAIKTQKKPLRAGQEKGEITVDIGDFIVNRKFRAKDDTVTSSITVATRDGARFQRPQEILDSLMGKLSFDPLAFARMSAKHQLSQLRALVPDFDFEKMDADNAADFEARTDVNREIKRLQTMADTITVDPELPQDLPDRDSLFKEHTEALQHNAGVDRHHAEADQLRASQIRKEQFIQETEQQIADLEKQLSSRRVQIVEATGEISALHDKIEALGEPPEKIDLDQIRERMEVSRECEAAIQDRDRKRELLADIKTETERSHALTEQMDHRRRQARNAIEAAKLPVDGMELTADGLIVDEVPFNQLSDARQLQISIAVAAALNPKLRVIRVRDGSLLDSDSMQALRDLATENDVQVWIERVTDGGGPGVVIEDGTVLSPSQDTKKKRGRRNGE